MSVRISTYVYDEAKFRRWAKYQPFKRCVIVNVAKEKHRPTSMFSPGALRKYQAHQQGGKLIKAGRTAEERGPEMVKRLDDLTKMVASMAAVLTQAQNILLNGSPTVGGIGPGSFTVPVGDIEQLMDALSEAHAEIARVSEAAKAPHLGNNRCARDLP